VPRGHRAFEKDLIMRLFLLLTAAALLPSLAAAQPQTAAPQPAPSAPASGVPPAPSPKAEEVKVNQLIVYGQDPCPKSTNDEITVCARMPESERYRIPPDLRDNPSDPRNQSWTNKAQRLEMAGLTGIASCSPVGPGAGAGCLTQLIRQAAQERGMTGVDWNRLIEKARQERLGRIDVESEQIDRDQQQQDQQNKTP
jgi:hypothetical protein